MLLGLCAALFAVMAFSASGAQAAKWLILMENGEVLTGEQLKAEVKGEKDSAVIALDSKALGIEFQVLCTNFQTIGVSLEGEGKITEGGKVSFSGCSVDTNGKANPECEASAGGGAAGTIITNAGKGQLVLHVLQELKVKNEKGEEVIVKDTTGLTKIEPKEAGKPFVTISLGPKCPVGESLPVNGVLYLKDCENMVELHLVRHLVEQGPLTELWVTNNNNAEHKATLLGSGWILLSGAHTGLSFGGMPE
jgi:hypothetical protein